MATLAKMEERVWGGSCQQVAPIISVSVLQGTMANLVNSSFQEVGWKCEGI